MNGILWWASCKERNVYNYARSTNIYLIRRQDDTLHRVWNLLVSHLWGCSTKWQVHFASRSVLLCEFQDQLFAARTLSLVFFRRVSNALYFAIHRTLSFQIAIIFQSFILFTGLFVRLQSFARYCTEVRIGYRGSRVLQFLLSFYNILVNFQSRSKGLLIHILLSNGSFLALLHSASNLGHWSEQLAPFSTVSSLTAVTSHYVLIC